MKNQSYFEWDQLYLECLGNFNGAVQCFVSDSEQHELILPEYQKVLNQDLFFLKNQSLIGDMTHDILLYHDSENQYGLSATIVDGDSEWLTFGLYKADQVVIGVLYINQDLDDPSIIKESSLKILPLNSWKQASLPKTYEFKSSDLINLGEMLLDIVNG